MRGTANSQPLVHAHFYSERVHSRQHSKERKREREREKNASKLFTRATRNFGKDDGGGSRARSIRSI
jgi:hypothetical protein